MPARPPTRGHEPPGDRRARFEALYEATYVPILGYARRRTADPADANDVVAEVFTTAWRRFDDIPEGEEARLWLYGVARRVLSNHHRGRARRSRLTATLRADLPRLVRTSEPAVGEGPDGDAIAAAFARLRDEDRDLLLLVGVEALDRDQVSRVTGRSRADVRRRLHRARDRFARELARSGIEVGRTATAGDGSSTWAPALGTEEAR